MLTKESLNAVHYGGVTDYLLANTSKNAVCILSFSYQIFTT